MQQRKDDVKKLLENVKQIQALQYGGKSKIKNERKVETKGLKDLGNTDGDENIPEVDISEGLAQIEEQKKIFDEGLLKISKQVDNMKEAANKFAEELDKQSELLDKIGADVDKYNEKLSKLNERMDKALAQVGGSFRMLIIIFGLIIGLVILFICCLVFEIWGKNLINGVTGSSS